MARYYDEKGAPSSRRFPSLAQPGKYVGYREHQNEIGRPLPSPIKVPKERLEGFKTTRGDRMKMNLRQLRTAWVDAHATLYLKQQGISKPTPADVRRIKRDAGFKTAVANLFSSDPDLHRKGQFAIYGQENFEKYPIR